MLLFASVAFARPLCGLPLVVDRPRPDQRGPANAVAQPVIDGPKGFRNPYDTPHYELSENFAVHWGPDGGVTQEHVDLLIATFETSWDVQIDGMGHVAPYRTDDYLFNIYVGDSGAGAPPGYGAGGYYSSDPDGWPVVVIAAETLGDPTFTEHAAAHEFYHAVQGATERYEYAGISAWYTEATAEWAAVETLPKNPLVGPFVYAYGLLPELPVNYFDYPDTGIVEEAYQYGAFVFPTHVAEVTDWQLIRDTWTNPGTEEDPLEVMRTLLDERGHSLDEVFLDHAARNATWDYLQGDLFEQTVGLYGDWYDLDPVLARYSGVGTDGIRKARGRAPGRYGYNLISLRNPIDDGTLEVRIWGDAEGTLSSPARFGARLVRDDGSADPTYLSIPFDADGFGELTVEAVDDDEEIWLVVGAWTEEATPFVWEEEQFEYDYELVVSEPPAGEPWGDSFGEGREVVCGCRTASGGAGPVVLLVLALCAGRRRQPDPTSCASDASTT